MITQINHFSCMPKFIEKTFIKIKTNKTNATIPAVTTPIVLYNTISDAKKRTAKIISEADKTKKTVTDTTEANTKALKKAGVMKKDIKKELDNNGELKNDSTKKALDQKKIAHKGSPEEATMTDNIESDVSETESYTNQDVHSSFLDNIQNKISEGLENLKEKIADSFESIKDNIYNTINNVFPHSWNELKENLASHVGEIKENTHNIISNTFKGSTTEIHRYTIRDIAEHPELMDNLSIEEIKQIDVSMCPELEEFLQTPPDEVPDGLMDNILEELPEGFGVGDETLYETLKGVVENATDMLG